MHTTHETIIVRAILNDRTIAEFERPNTTVCQYRHNVEGVMIVSTKNDKFNGFRDDTGRCVIEFGRNTLLENQEKLFIKLVKKMVE